MTLSVITGANDNSASVNAWKTVRKQKVQMADKAEKMRRYAQRSAASPPAGNKEKGRNRSCAL
ncbi:hypothetical protein HF675_05310 [Serratia sp. JUb9]|uniref:hypothetical protein n=1 Tax=unclassified Serratia (in: enterobacteria) TaxID=2647522 RepID=UPI000CF67184|nr:MULTISPECIES: hypothetical protein [unclassified Serratia (in: enterobacteria)]MBU3894542.1 hypothetical protein [Serratia rubidaea]AVJ19013.1 hypothetical protein CLM71_18700 [Serratia sp. MYb239]MCA4824070.1 hypothetical protein [Serratia rubidaea]QNK33480.1 hypothetical protein HF675_05310 [Serratia sp. JUb9]QPT13803.1 hypothetical protein I6G37_01860 [Serratia rubidaea]